MKRIVKLSNKYYGYDLGEDIDGDDFLSDILGFIDQCDPVIIVNDFEDAEVFDIYKEDIIIVE